MIFRHPFSNDWVAWMRRCLLLISEECFWLKSQPVHGLPQPQTSDELLAYLLCHSPVVLGWCHSCHSKRDVIFQWIGFKLVYNWRGKKSGRCRIEKNQSVKAVFAGNICLICSTFSTSPAIPLMEIDFDRRSAHTIDQSNRSHYEMNRFFRINYHWLDLLDGYEFH